MKIAIFEGSPIYLECLRSLLGSTGLTVSVKESIDEGLSSGTPTASKTSRSQRIR